MSKLQAAKSLVGVRGFRTSDPIVPNDVRYQAALHSDTAGRFWASERPYRGVGHAAQALLCGPPPDPKAANASPRSLE